MRKLLAAASAVVSLFVFVSCQEPGTTGTPGGGGSGGGNVSSTTSPLVALRPVVGGHLVISTDKTLAVVADPDGDRLRTFNLTNATAVDEIKFAAGAWPTRVMALPTGQIQVLLRGTGELATVTLPQGGHPAAIAKVAVCPEPRGLTRNGDETIVACAGGELVHVGAEVTTERTATEWRDVVVNNGNVVGTSFRAAQLIKAGAATNLQAQRVTTDFANPAMHQPQVAWRLLSNGGSLVVVHQLHADQIHVDGLTTTTPPNPGIPSSGSPYGGGGTATTPNGPPQCSGSAVVTGVTRFDESGNMFTAHTNDVLPVDAALSPDGSMLAVAGAGGTGLSVYPTSLVQGSGGCMTPTAGVGGISVHSVAWVSPTQVVFVETLRSTPVLFDLANGMAKNLGSMDQPAGAEAHTLFHQSPRGGAALACASCHPEGGDDGHVWIIDGKFRRTQNLTGGVMSRAPFHWVGDLAHLDDLMADTFVKRMGAAPVTGDTVNTLGAWLDTLPANRPSVVLTTDARAAGLAAFTKAGCVSCHLDNGRKEGSAADIGTGESVRTPSLSGVASRAPYLHTGEVATLRDRVFGSLHPNHGNLAVLDQTEKQALLEYLEAL
ncbi:MAG: hypothetical protein U0228_23765 [Myxococcaceae bacterium]